MPGMLSTLVSAGADRLRRAQVEEPWQDARRLADEACMRLLGRRPVPHEQLDEQVATFLENWIGQREQRRPVSQIIGRRPFFDFEFEINSDVLDPRPESELLVESGLSLRPNRILDLGTGSGCLLLSLLGELSDATGLGIDISDASLAIANSNSRRLGLHGRAEFQLSNWLEQVVGHFDLIVANPPYLSAQEYEDSPPELRLWEPPIALTSGGDGLSSYREISRKAADHLSDNGSMLLEIGPGRRQSVERILEGDGWTISDIAFDLDGRPRCLSASAPSQRTF